MHRNFRIAAAVAMIAQVFVVVATPVRAADRHAGYYYPEPQTREEYYARSSTVLESNRRKRIDFVNGLTAQTVNSAYPPQFAVFAKGAGADKLIIVSLYDNAYNTLYRSRALLAILTAISRRTPFFKASKAGDVLTFFDLLFLLGFKQITISDGASFAHQVELKGNR